MTTIVKITNVGPELLTLQYYGENRLFLDKRDYLKVGESTEVTVWNGNVPVLLAEGIRTEPLDEPKFYSVPPAHM